MKKMFIALFFLVTLAAHAAYAESGILLGTQARTFESLKMGMIQTVKLQYVSFRDYSNSEYGFGIETSLGQQKLGVLVSFSDINNNNLAYISELGYFSIFGKARQYFEGNKFNKDGFFGELNAAYIMMRDKNNAGFNGYDFGGALGYSMIIDKKWIFEPNIL